MGEKKTRLSLFGSVFTRVCIAASLALSGLIMLPSGRVSAATIVVTETDDHLHGGVVGTCNSGVDCTLREAIELANTSALTEDTIVFASGLSGATITLTSTITVISPITISGPAARLTITGSGIRLFTSGSMLIMENLVLMGGAGAPYGGAIYNQNGALTVRNMMFVSNQATDPINGTGGAIYNNGLLTVEKCVFQGNTAGAINGGGAIFNQTGPMTITNSTFTTNTGTQGGAVSLVGGTLSLTGSTFASNSAGMAGGSVYIAPVTSASIVNSTFYSNFGGFNGGAIYNMGTLDLNFSTIVNNNAVTSGSGFYTSGGATVNNTIVAMNTNGDCAGAIGSGSHNLTDDATCGAGFTYTANPMVMGPADNGGDTLTYSLHPLSPAINAAASCIATDQRGMNRGATCDIGAYEYDGQPDLSINDVSVTEGNSGTITAAFTVTLSAPALAGGVTFDIATADGTATTADSDYVAANQTGVTIPQGSSTATFDVTVNGDTSSESNEIFFVNITNVTGAIVSDGQGQGNITNDDLSADLSVTITDSPDPVTAGQNLVYTITVNNAGPSPASTVNYTTMLAPQTTFVSLSSLAGWTCTTPAVGAGGTVSCSNASLASGYNGALTLTVKTDDGLAPGTIINQSAEVSGTPTDPNPGNNSAATNTSVNLLALATTEAATNVLYSTATLNGQVNPLGIEVDVVFQYGETISYGSTATVTSPGSGTAFVPVVANLTSLSPFSTYHYRVAATNSYGTSYGEDMTFTTANYPVISIDDVSHDEGASGVVTYTFTVGLSDPPPADGANFDISTVDGTATSASSDYTSRQELFVPMDKGVDSYTFTVDVNGDRISETDEIFYVNISNLQGLVAGDTQGLGTITNDDTAGITVNPTSGLTTTEAGGTTSFTVVLGSQPTANVTIGLTSSDTSEGTVSSTSLTFDTANWNTPQTGTITGGDDALADGDIGYTIQVGPVTSADPQYNGLDPADVNVTNTDDDTASASLTIAMHDAAHTVISAAAEGDLLHASATAVGNGTLVPTGNVTFSYFNNIICAGTAAGTETVALDTAGLADMTTTALLTADGLSFTAHYAGNSTYPAADSACGSISSSPYPTVLVTSAGTVPSDFANLPTGISSIQLQFNRDVMHDSNGNPNSVTYPANYLLVERGPNGILDTLSCFEGVGGDDRQFTVNTVSYDAATYRATVHVNNGVQLTDGIYRLYVCGTTSIYSADGSTALNNHASDSTIIFIVGTGISSGGSSSKKSVATGFTPGIVTTLPEQPAGLAYSSSELWIEIPALGIKQPIVGVPQTENGWDVSWLGNDVGYLQGTAFPTWAGNSVLTGHVTGADGLPGVFADLGTLKWGDEIIVHAFGQKYVYEVQTVDLSASPNTSRIVDKHEDLPWLTLITCRGYDEKTNTYRYRTIVRAVQVSVEEE